MTAHDDRQGSGKHPHKDSQDPRPHHEGQKSGSQQDRHSGGEHRSSEAGRSGGEHRSGQASGGSQSESLKGREYRDAQGNVHHHTKTYEEQHGKGSGKK